MPTVKFRAVVSYVTACSLLLAGCDPKPNVSAQPSASTTTTAIPQGPSEDDLTKITEATTAVQKITKELKESLTPSPGDSTPPARPLEVDSYEAFLLAFYAFTSKQYPVWRQETTSKIEEFVAATTKRPKPADPQPLRTKLAELTKQKEILSDAQNASVVKCTTLLEQYEKSIRTVEELVNGIITGTEPSKSAIQAIDAAVEEIKQKKMTKDAIKAHLATGFSEDGAIGKHLLLIERNRDNLTKTLQGLNPAVEKAISEYRQLEAALDELSQLIKDPELPPIINNYKKENKALWTSVAAILGMINPIFGIAAMIVCFITGKCGPGGGGESGTNDNGKGKSDMPPNQETEAGGSPPPPTPENTKRFDIKLPMEGEFKIHPYEDNQGRRFLLIERISMPGQKYTLHFSLASYGPAFKPLADAGTSLEIKSIEMLYPFPATMKVIAGDREDLLQWDDENTPPRLIRTPEKGKIPEDLEPLPTQTLTEGEYAVVLAKKGDQHVYLIEKNGKLVTLTFKASDLGIALPGKEHLTTVKSISHAGDSLKDPFPVTLVIKRVSDDGTPEELDVVWESSTATGTIANGRK